MAEQTKKRLKSRFKSTYLTEEAEELILYAFKDPQIKVVRAAIRGAGFRPHLSMLPYILKYLDHPKADFRNSVASALSYFEDVDAFEQLGGIAALLKLMTDSDADVRYYATAAFSMDYIEIDSPSIREALWNNLSDSDLLIRGEALTALARRRDTRAMAIVKTKLINILTALQNNSLKFKHQYQELEAATILAAPELYLVLKDIDELSHMQDEDLNWFRSDLKEAMNACRPNKTKKE